MVKISWLGLTFIGLALFSTGCSSLKKRALGLYLKNFKDKKAETAQFSPPPPPYKEQKHPVLDALWWNPQSASSISYFSSCSKLQKTLQEFQKDSFPQNGQYKLLKNTRLKKGLYSILEIINSDQKTYSGIYTIKKGQCLFNINLVTGSYAVFSKEEPVFKAFVRSFHFK